MSPQTSTLNFSLFFLRAKQLLAAAFMNKICVYDFSCFWRIYLAGSIQYTGWVHFNAYLFGLFGLLCAVHIMWCAMFSLKLVRLCIVHCALHRVKCAVCSVQWVRYLASKAFVHDGRIVGQHWRCGLKFVSSEIIQSDSKNLSPYHYSWYMDKGESY